MTLEQWPCPLEGGGTSHEYAVVVGAGQPARLLIVPPLFDEGNRLRRLILEVMRRLSAQGIVAVMPDLPGTNESLLPLEQQTVTGWSNAMAAAASHFRTTHTLGVRGGCLFTPADGPVWHYAPVKAASILRQLMRARILASREAGRDERQDTLQALASTEGIELAGYRIGAPFFREFEMMTPDPAAHIISQDSIGGSGLWLRAEPGDDAAQADALAVILARALTP